MKDIYLTIFIILFSNSLDSIFIEPKPKNIIANNYVKAKPKKLPLVNVRRTGANIANDFNNPGCLRLPNDCPEIVDLAIGEAYGQIKENGKYLVFGMIEHGWMALQIWIEKHEDITLQRAIITFAPHFENNTPKYIIDMCAELSVGMNTKLKDINEFRLMSAISKMEGYKDN